MMIFFEGGSYRIRWWTVLFALSHSSTVSAFFEPLCPCMIRVGTLWLMEMLIVDKKMYLECGAMFSRHQEWFAVPRVG
jgi:hypothetical protein